MEQERMAFLDSAKGLAIFLMVFAHCIAWNLDDYQSVLLFSPEQSERNTIAGLLNQIIYSFHMPLFFLISGYLTQAPTNKQYLNKVLRRSKQLLIPWITTGFIMLYIKGYYGYWFLLSLWQLCISGYLFHYTSSFLNKNKKMSIDIVIIFVYFILFKILFNEQYKIYNIEVCKFLIFFPAYFFGIFIRKYTKLTNILFQLKYISLYYITFGVLFSLRYLEFITAENALYILINKINEYVLPIIGSLAVILYFKNRTTPIKVLQILGVKSLSIYIFHILFVIQIPIVGEWIITQSPVTCITLQLVYHSILSFIAIGLSLVLENIISYAKPIKTILLGSK
jgi:fucose 4-O-acetylase-like acetyltransferase